MTFPQAQSQNGVPPGATQEPHPGFGGQPQSLSSIANANLGGAGHNVVAPAAGDQQAHGYQPTVDQPAATTPPVAPTGPVAAAPASPQVNVPVPGSQPAGGQPAVNPGRPIAERFAAMGFDVPPDMSDDEFIETVARQIDESVRIQSDGNASSSTQPTPPPGQTPEGNGNPGDTRPSPAGEPQRGKPRLSPEAEALARQGLIRKGENGWESTNPAFNQFAEEYNRIEAYRQAMALRLIDDPAEFIREHVQAADSGTVDELKKEIEDLKKVISSHQNAAARNEIESWISQNESILFTDGSRRQLTNIGQAYDRFHEEMRSLNPKAPPEEIHKKVVYLMETAGLIGGQPQSAATRQPVSNQPQTQPASQTFMAAAASAAPSPSGNRLAEHYQTPAAQPSGVTIPGRKGRPSLSEIANMLKQGPTS